MIGLESCFAAVNTILKKEKNVSLLDFIALLTVNPRKLMGFDTDLFQEGTEAELTILSPDETWVFDEDSIYSRSLNSPFTGESFIGKVNATLVRGNMTVL